MNNIIKYVFGLRYPKIPEFENIDNILERISQANITPVFKKSSKKKRPVSVLLVLYKIFQETLSKQLSSYFGNILSTFKCGFRKGLTTQHCLLLLI